MRRLLLCAFAFLGCAHMDLSHMDRCRRAEAVLAEVQSHAGLMETACMLDKSEICQKVLNSAKAGVQFAGALRAEACQ